ncbi:MAG: MmgE/PrpD family protein [Pseudomonadota bacterium]
MRIGSSLTAELIKLIREKQVTDEDLKQAGLFTLDAIACIAAGRNTETGKRLTRWAEVLGDGTGGMNGLDPARRAFLSGAFGHQLELHATHKASVSAPGCAVVPVVLALGQGLPVRDVLTAVLHGVEVVTRIGAATGDTQLKLWDNTSVAGPFGSALAAASLLGLNPEQTVAALGNAGTQAAGLWEFISSGTDTKTIHAGRAAEAGLVSATLAALDMKGPLRILEGPRGLFPAICPDGRIETVLDDRRAPWKIHDISFSVWPFSHLTHPTISATFKVREQILEKGLDPTNYTRMEIETYQAAAERCDRVVLSTARSARYSLQHAAACAMWDGEVDLNSFSEEARRRLAPKRERTAVSATLDFSMRYPDAWGARVTAHLPQAQPFTAIAQESRGDPEKPLSEDALLEKVEALLAYGDYAGSEALALLAEDPTGRQPFEVSVF